MINYTAYLILHLLICTIFFACIQRPIFFYANRKSSNKPVGLTDLIQSSKIGLKTDFAGSAYLTGLPLLVLWSCAYIRPESVAVPLMVAEGIVAIVMSLVAVGDTILYGYWKFRIDVSVFAYLRSIKSALASVTAAYAVAAIAIVLALAVLIFGIFYALGLVTGVYVAQTSPNTILTVLGKTGVFVLCGCIIFACIRGINHRPNSPYHLYYSTNMYLNHTAVNPIFNLAYSASVQKKENDSFKIYDTDECNTTVKEMLPTQGTPTIKLLNTDRPNILVIVWESLSALFTSTLGEKKGVTENVDRLCDEGILFTHVDAGSWRTDPAMVCILSGYPGQPTTSIMRDTHKLPGLPALPRTLKEKGYTTSVVHGGPLSYMHMIDYFIATGHDRIIGINDINDPDATKCAWGIHDGYMFDWLYDDIIRRTKAEEPWYTTFLTLSSHQPYIVPFNKFDDAIDNSYAYTDEAFGKFIDRLKTTAVWQNTLIVVMGDHGINMDSLPRHEQPHIPLLLLGGAIKESMKIDRLMSQTDFAATLLGQLDIPHDQFIFSRDVLADTYKYPFSINIYNNGFLYRDATGYTEFDNVAKRAVDGADEERERRGRMFMQYMMDDLSRR